MRNRMNTQSWQLQAEVIQSDDVSTQVQHLGRVFGNLEIVRALPRSAICRDDEDGESRSLDRFGGRLPYFEMHGQGREGRGQGHVHRVTQFSSLVFQRLQIRTALDEFLPLLHGIHFTESANPSVET
jgi:hypothetical protein